ncbi:MAG TPA: sirohydrochlorin nickelochelatase [Acidobacteriota bacterium]|nr:sirohydrochlorin nickelochelatase [Acidobacteriota bacterium]
MDEVALVLIGHGSKLPHNRENLVKLAEILRKKSQFKTVEISFMVRNTPTIPQAIESIVKRGIKKIVLVPAFLAAGVHTEQEIPEMIGLKGEESAFKARGIELLYGEPLGADERIADIIEEKALKALEQRETEEKTAPDASKLKTSVDTFAKSIVIIRKELGNTLANVPKENVPVIERVVHTTAEPELAKLLTFSDGAVKAGVGAIKAGAKIVTDVKMVKAGINEARVKRFGGKTLTYIDDSRAVKLAEKDGISRSAAAIRLAVNEGVDGAIILIGNAPTAAFELAKAVKKGQAKPALIVATPVGYIGAAESKEVIATLPVPFIILRTRKGGSAVAVAIFNALLAMAEGKTTK